MYTQDEVNGKIRGYSIALNTLNLEVNSKKDKEEIKRVSDLLDFWKNYKTSNL